jgi:hypothetical protein
MMVNPCLVSPAAATTNGMKSEEMRQVIMDQLAQQRRTIGVAKVGAAARTADAAANWNAGLPKWIGKIHHTSMDIQTKLED